MNLIELNRALRQTCAPRHRCGARDASTSGPSRADGHHRLPLLLGLGRTHPSQRSDCSSDEENKRCSVIHRKPSTTSTPLQSEDESKPGLRSGHRRVHRSPRRRLFLGTARHREESFSTSHRTRGHRAGPSRHLPRNTTLCLRKSPKHSVDGTRRSTWNYCATVPLLIIDASGDGAN